MTTTWDAFNEFSRRIALTDAQKQTVNDRRSSMARTLTAAFPATSNMPVQTVTLIGSAARNTMIRPLDDVDVLAVFDHTNVWPTYRSDSQKLLYRVRDALGRTSRVETVGARGQAVRFFYAERPWVDVTPAFKRQGGGYIIPAGDKTWIATNPILHTSFMKRRNEELSGNLVGFVRKLKAWNRAHSNRLGSFHLEMMTQALFKSLGSNSRTAAEVFFGAAARYLDTEDPAGFSGNLAAGMTAAQRRETIESFTAHHERAVKAVAAEGRGNHGEAIRLWRVVFGDDFPAG